VENNTIEWVFKGVDQLQAGAGVYSLVLSVVDAQGAMVTTDACKFVELVACSCETGGADDAGVQTESVDLVSKVDIGGNGGGSYDDSELREAIEGLDNRIAAHSEDIVNLQENKADKSELTELSAEVGKKQDTITDLETIRSGAAKGATSIQKVKTINGQSIEGEGDLVIEAGGGLKHSEERTVYLTKIDLLGEIEDTFEITEEQREYNRETVRLASDNEMPVTLNKGGQMFAPYTSGSSEARFIASYVGETETWSFTIFINDNGNAEGTWKVIPMGATKEELATLLEGFIPLSRDFSDDFNNDFSR
jgi:hypothetical protein